MEKADPLGEPRHARVVAGDVHYLAPRRRRDDFAENHGVKALGRAGNHDVARTRQNFIQ